MNNLIISATSKYLRVSPTKLDKIITKIRGKTYREALIILKYLPQKSSALVWQTLYSAGSNASANFALEKDELMVCEAFVNSGSTLKRIQPRARGKAYQIKKRSSHITIRVKSLETQNTKES
jgi:large subunit ribosomal protein L22